MCRIGWAPNNASKWQVGFNLVFKGLRNKSLHYKLALKQQEIKWLSTNLKQRQEIAKIPDWPRRKAVAEFRLCVGHDCFSTHLHHIGICPDPYCMLCSLCIPMDRNHLGQCTALFNGTECERYWEARTEMMENWLCSFSITIFCDYYLLLGLSYSGSRLLWSLWDSRFLITITGW